MRNASRKCLCIQRHKDWVPAAILSSSMTMSMSMSVATCRQCAKQTFPIVYTRNCQICSGGNRCRTLLASADCSVIQVAKFMPNAPTTCGT